MNATGLIGEDAAEANRLPESSPLRNVGFLIEPTCQELPYFTIAKQKELVSMIGYRGFSVLDVPYCVWDLEPKKRNLEFIERIDPEYYDYIADVNGEALRGDNSQYAATTVRIAYCHGLETLFALLGACIQAPDCVVGWLQKYRPFQLRKLVTAIFNRRNKIRCKLNIQSATMEELSGLINRFNLRDEKEIQRLKGLFSTLWYRFAGDFLSEELVAEYNSLKHGFRINPGGFKLIVGPESTPGVAAPEDRMTSLGGSDFGSSFFLIEGIGVEADKKNTTHFRLKAKSLNWDPEGMAAGLRLISISLNNILAFLKILNGSSEDVTLRYPCDESYFEIPSHNGAIFPVYQDDMRNRLHAWEVSRCRVDPLLLRSLRIVASKMKPTKAVRRRHKRGTSLASPRKPDRVHPGLIESLRCSAQMMQRGFG